MPQLYNQYWFESNGMNKPTTYLTRRRSNTTAGLSGCSFTDVLGSTVCEFQAYQFNTYNYRDLEELYYMMPLPYRETRVEAKLVGGPSDFYASGYTGLIKSGKVKITPKGEELFLNSPLFKGENEVFLERLKRLNAAIAKAKEISK